MSDGSLDAQLHSRSSSSFAVTSLAPVCARAATRAVGLATTAFTGRTPPRLSGRIAALPAVRRWCSAVKCPADDRGPEQSP